MQLVSVAIVGWRENVRDFVSGDLSARKYRRGMARKDLNHSRGCGFGLAVAKYRVTGRDRLCRTLEI
jgi:hypothetical protein